MEQLCEILGYLHERTPAIIYGDMKPSNVICREDGRLALIDLGAARQDGEQEFLIAGTKAYAPPEQSEIGVCMDARADIYSLGVTMYRMLTGKRPERVSGTEQARHGRAWRGQMRSGRAYSRNTRNGKDVNRILQRCMQEDRERRYASCRELGRDLHRLRRRTGYLLLSLLALFAGATGH